MTSYPELIRELYNENGIRSFYKGFWPTFWRDVPMYGEFFFIHNYLCKKMIKKSDSDAKRHLKLIWISGIAGVINWLPTFPADIIKSIIQCHQGPETLKMS